MPRLLILSLLLCALAFGTPARSAHAEDAMLDPAKIAQLHRLEPISPAILKAFVDAGQLSQAQADYITRNLTPDGKLVLADGAPPAPAPQVQAPQPPPMSPPPPPPQPRTAVAPPPLPPQEPQAPPDAPPPPRGVPVERDVYADFHYVLPAAEQEHLRTIIRDYRHGDHAGIGRELRNIRPQINQLINQYYNDPVDLPIKLDLWQEVAGGADPEAALGLSETHRILYETAKPILIAYDKDAGGVTVRRRHIGPEAADAPAERFFTSRELRDMIEKCEGLIARCNGATAAIFLMNVYSQRYGPGEAPLRDTHRDRIRLVEACGGNVKKFDEDEPKTWTSTLSQHERAIIAETLIPWLHAENSDRRQIARNGLMVCIPHHHPKYDAGRAEWDRWWEQNKAALMAEK